MHSAHTHYVHWDFHICIREECARFFFLAKTSAVSFSLCLCLLLLLFDAMFIVQCPGIIVYRLMIIESN